MWAIEGGIAMSSLHGAVSPAYRVYRPADDVDSHFLHHLLRSRPYLEQYKQLIRGTTTFDRAISKEDFADLPIILPSLEEQRRIADFLDAETARLGKIAHTMRQQESLLAERRHHIMDLSSEAAEGAPRFRLGYATTLVTSGSRGWGDYVSDSGALFFRSANLYSDSIQPKLKGLTFVTLPEATRAEAARSRIQLGDVLVGITGANAGWVALANDDVAGGYVSQHVCLARPEAHKVDSEWLAFLIASPSIQRALMESQYGGTKTQLSLPDIRNIRIPSISLLRQKEIAREVKRHASLIDRQRAFRRRQIELLGERQQALITAAVTGQFDVSTASGRGVTE
ncbi:restriction endonuclease subunit S [Actinomadura welshii]